MHQQGVSLDDIYDVQPQIKSIPSADQFKNNSFPVVSIVKGMTFSLVDMTGAPDLLAAVKAGEAPKAAADSGWDDGLVGCLYYESLEREAKGAEPPIQRIHQRMIEGGIEDPGTGSASCALACYLALNQPWENPEGTDHEKTAKVNNGQEAQKDERPDIEKGSGIAMSDTIEEKGKTLSLNDKKKRFVFAMEQGAEVQRRCQICVEVDIIKDEQGNKTISSVILSGRSCMVLRGEILGIY